jgi:hypothetical protein
MRGKYVRGFLTAVCVASCSGAALAIDSPADAFTYQGILNDATGPASGPHDLFFTLLDGNGSIIRTLCADNVPVVAGQFSVQVQVGPDLPSLMREAYWLRISVRPDAGLDCGDATGLQDLAPEQALTSAPRAARATQADNAANANTLAGLSPAQLTNAGNLTGTLPDAALSVNVPRLNAPNIFGGTNAFAGIQMSGPIDNPTGPLQLRSNGTRGLMIDFRSGHPNIIAGSSSNVILSPAYAAAIGGGMNNSIAASWANIGGGSSNTVNTAGDSATIGGGSQNQAQAFHATIAGGYFNTVSGSSAVVGGGALNSVTANFGTIAGGSSSDLLDSFNTNNRVTDDYGFVGGGGNNRAGDSVGSTQDAWYATVGAGRDNRATGVFSSVLGGSGNRASSQYSSVGGGVNNRASGGFSTIAGGSENAASGFVATVSGGDFHLASGDRSFIGGGNGNIASGAGSAIASGFSNRSQGFMSFVGGGDVNIASGDRSVLGGGYSNQATGPFSTMSGGIYNQATAYGSTVVGGDANLASGDWSSVLGGIDNQATAIGSFAGGTRARALHEGAFVWSDRSDLSAGVYTTSTAANQVTVRAAGGVRVIGNVGVTGNINFATPRITYRMYSVGEFLPGTRNSPDVPVRTGFYGEIIRGPSGTSNITLRVPLNLPHGSRIRDISIFYNDNDASRHMRFFLLRTTLPNQVASIVSEVTTEAQSGSQRTGVLPLPTPIVVDNQNAALELVVQPERPDTNGWVIEWAGGFADSQLQIAGMRITYETDGPSQ